MGGLALLWGAVFSLVADAAPKPHILVILVDDWGHANVGFHASALDRANNETQTPNLDALAAEGILLERHYTFRASLQGSPTAHPGARGIAGAGLARLTLQGSPAAHSGARAKSQAPASRASRCAPPPALYFFRRLLLPHAQRAAQRAQPHPRERFQL